MNPNCDELDRLSDALYERYAKPLEAERWGEYIAISASGESVMGTDIADVRYRSLDRLGRGAFVFKIGARAVGKLRGSAKPPILAFLLIGKGSYADTLKS